jgi:hypothetical protein
MHRSKLFFTASPARRPAPREHWWQASGPYTKVAPPKNIAHSPALVVSPTNALQAATVFGAPRALAAGEEAQIGLGRIVALYRRSSTLYQIH